MSSSSSEVPLDVLAASKVDTPASPQQQPPAIPDWITGFQSPLSDRTTKLTSSSDHDFKADLSDDARSDGALEAGPAPLPPSSAARAQAKPKAKAKKADKPTPAAKKAPVSASKARKDAAADRDAADEAARSTAPQANKLQQQPQTLQEAAQPDAADTGPGQAQADMPAEKAKPKATRVLADPSVCQGEVPLMLPEKLATGKYLMELEPAKDGADDLTGDAGAVGRMLVSGKGESASLQIDLKGALYNAALAPSACTLAVINLGPSEARVEMMASQFLQLERVHGLGDDDEGEQHLWDDQDQEQEYATLDDQPKVKKGRKIKAQPAAGEKKPGKRLRKTVSKGKAGVKKGGQKKGGGKKAKGK